ncbi:MAG: ATP-dependent Clp protease adaptor ClpS [Desulfotalea sp.]
MSQFSHESDISIIDDIDIRKPSMYKVLLHNDDYTSMDFVVLILTDIFSKSVAEAERIMLNVHQKGIGVAGVYTFELAETKIEIVKQMAQQNEFPLHCSMEQE